MHVTEHGNCDTEPAPPLAVVENLIRVGEGVAWLVTVVALPVVLFALLFPTSPDASLAQQPLANFLLRASVAGGAGAAMFFVWRSALRAATFDRSSCAFLSFPDRGRGLLRCRIRVNFPFPPSGPVTIELQAAIPTRKGLALAWSQKTQRTLPGDTVGHGSATEITASFEVPARVFEHAKRSDLKCLLEVSAPFRGPDFKALFRSPVSFREMAAGETGQVLDELARESRQTLEEVRSGVTEARTDNATTTGRPPATAATDAAADAARAPSPRAEPAPIDQQEVLLRHKGGLFGAYKTLFLGISGVLFPVLLVLTIVRSDPQSTPGPVMGLLLSLPGAALLWGYYRLLVSRQRGVMYRDLAAGIPVAEVGVRPRSNADLAWIVVPPVMLVLALVGYAQWPWSQGPPPTPKFVMAPAPDPAHDSPELVRGYELLSRGDAAAAEDAFTKALAAGGDRGAASYWRGVTRDRLGDHRGAVADLERAANELEPAFPAVLYLDRVHVQRGGYRKVIRAWDAYLKRNPGDGRALYERAGARSHLPGEGARLRADVIRACDLGYRPACNIAERLR